MSPFMREWKQLKQRRCSRDIVQPLNAAAVTTQVPEFTQRAAQLIARRQQRGLNA